jgi:integrase
LAQKTDPKPTRYRPATLKRLRITRELIEKLTAKATGERLTMRDTELKGFALRISQTGAVSFAITYRDRTGTERLYTLTSADFGDAQNPGSPDDARDVARAIKKRLAKDAAYDPQTARDARRAAAMAVAEATDAAQIEANARTLGALCDEWFTRRAGKRSLVGDKSKIERYLRPHLGKVPVSALTADAVADMHAQIVASGKRVMANRVVSLLSALWALAGEGVRGHKGAIKVRGLHWVPSNTLNPARGLQNSDYENDRDVTMTPEEFGRVSAALRAEGDTPAVRALQLLAWTMARRDEVLTMEWSHLDLRLGVWVRPASVMKAGKRHAGQLSAPAVDLLLKMQAERKDDSPFVFPGRDHCLMAVRRTWDRVRNAAGVPHITIHDIRRTMATWAVSRGRVDIFKLSKMLGHADVRVTQKHYGHLADEAARAGFEALAGLIEDATAIGASVEK